jgi:O-acetyl-ADP-ribose deacetylase (regulator of RNase III)
MLMYRRTSILESNAQTVVNTVNCVGVMGKGLAQAFKKRDPKMFRAYEKICDQKLLEPGKLWLWRGNKWILNFPTKLHWRNPSKISWIEAGLEKFVTAYEEQGITEVSFPLLGCGNGGLDWNDVRPVMEYYLSNLPIPVYIHDFTVDVGLPEHLEALAERLRAEASSTLSYDDFMKSIQRAVDLGGSNLIEIATEKAFSARMSSNLDLLISVDDKAWHFDAEDLRGVWLGLQNGVVTKEKAGWAAKEAGKPLLSILSVLPHMRPIEIQRKGASEAEIAVELMPSSRKLAIARQTKQQHELAWH